MTDIQDILSCADRADDLRLDYEASAFDTLYDERDVAIVVNALDMYAKILRRVADTGYARIELEET